MTSSFNLEDFIPVYPEQDDPDIQYKIGLKKEFLDVAAKISEPRPNPGELFLHQQAFKRYMLTSDRVLNIQSVGTGKTCAMVSIAEHYTNDPNYNNKVYIITRPSLASEIKKQIACDCTNKTYLTENVLDYTKDERNRLNALTRSIGKRYNINTYGLFAKEVSNTGMSDEELNRMYSGSIFLIDEAHYLNEKEEISKTKEENDEDPDIDPSTQDDSTKEEQYKVLWKLFHTVKRCKVILSTATPMINEVGEIAKLMNLLLPMEMQMPLKWNYNKVTIEQLEPFFRGRVSYVKAFETGASVEYEGVKMKRRYELEFPAEGQDIPFMVMKRDKNGKVIYEPEMPKVKTERKMYNSETNIFPLVMSEFQKKGYEKSVYDKNSFRSKENQAACFVFPDGSYGGDFITSRSKKGAGKFIQVTGVDNYDLDNTFKDNIKTNLSKYSAKYDFIINNEILAAQRRIKGEIVGTSFCYSELKTGGGAIMLGKVLEEYGFEMFNENNSVFTYTKTGQKEFCSNDSIDKIIKPDFVKKLRYAMLTPNMSDEKRHYLFELFNSPQNANGDYIQLMIGTKASREGINVFSCLRGYLLTPGWHASGIHQALARFLRATSHKYIIDLIKKKLISEGKDPAFARAIIKVYKIAALVSPEELDKEITIKLNDNEYINYAKSVDLDLYSIIEKKDISIKRMMHMLKRCAIDCPVHHLRNTYGDDKDGSDKCDYEKCKYTCFPSQLEGKADNEEIDYSTYDIFYAEDEIVKDCRDEIVKILSKVNTVNIKDLLNYTKLNRMYKNKYIIMAIDKIIKDKLTIKNKFGFPSFINIDGNTLFTQSEFPNYDNNINTGTSTLNIYKNTLFGFIEKSTDVLITEFSVNDDKSIFKKILSLEDPLGEDYDKLSKLFDKLTKEFQLIKIEEAFTNQIYATENPVFKAIAFKFINFFYYTYEPVTDISNTQKYLDTSNLRRGRNRKMTACPEIKDELIGGFKGPEEDQEVVYLHRISMGGESTGFKTNSQFFNTDNIRIFKPSENSGWRNVQPYECQAYKNIIRALNEEKLKPLIEKHEYIGTIFADKKFRIIKSSNFVSEKNDKRSTSKGTECTSFGHKLDLIDILLKSNYYDESINSVDINIKDKSTLINILINTYKVNRTFEDLSSYSLDDLIYINKWYMSSLSKEEICMRVKDLFYKEERIYEE